MPQQTRVLVTGAGGFGTINDGELTRRVRTIRDHGSERRYYHDLIGMNVRLDELPAVVLRAKLPHLEEWNAQCRKHAALYSQLLRHLPVVTPASVPTASTYIISASSGHRGAMSCR